MRLALQRRRALAQIAALPAQQLAVDQHALALHFEQHLAHRHLDRLVDVQQLWLALETRMERAMQAQRDIGVLGRVRGRAIDCHLLERDAPGALAGDVVVGDRREIEMPSRQSVHVVRPV